VSVYFCPQSVDVLGIVGTKGIKSDCGDQNRPGPTRHQIAVKCNVGNIGNVGKGGANKVKA
jgi:hypothetical protein